MNKNSANRTILILFLAIIIPIAFYTVYQVQSLNKNEEILSEIYKNQLESIIFSVNQYSDDILKSLQYKLENRLENGDPIDANTLLSYPGIAEVIIKPLSGKPIFTASGDSSIYTSLLEKTLSENENKVKKLIDYKKVEFTKLEPLDPITFQGEQLNLLLLVLKSKDDLAIGLIVIRPIDFIEGTLAPKMQQISGANFIITARSEIDQALIFSTDTISDVEARSLPFWLLPDHQIGIVQKGDSLETISKERIQLNFVWIAVLSVVVLMGFYVVARNLRKEMQLAQMKSDFASSVSHEIRTPLTLINMFAETLLLKRVPTEEKKQEYYEIITKETSRLKNIVNKILNFSQMENKKRTFELISDSLNDILKETIHTYSFHLENKGFAYQVEYGEESPFINADREAITEAIINLIDNAMKYSGESKKLNIFSGTKSHYTFVAVQDFGIGIDPKKQKLIFDKFFRVTEGDLYNVQGAGLGLSIVKNIMDAHNGKIEIESSLGKGSTFKLLFPIKQD